MRGRTLLVIAFVVAAISGNVYLAYHNSMNLRTSQDHLAVSLKRLASDVVDGGDRERNTATDRRLGELLRDVQPRVVSLMAERQKARRTQVPADGTESTDSPAMAYPVVTKKPTVQQSAFGGSFSDVRGLKIPAAKTDAPMVVREGHVYENEDSMAHDAPAAADQVSAGTQRGHRALEASAAKAPPTPAPVPTSTLYFAVDKNVPCMFPYRMGGKWVEERGCYMDQDGQPRCATLVDIDSGEVREEGECRLVDVSALTAGAASDKTAATCTCSEDIVLRRHGAAPCGPACVSLKSLPAFTAEVPAPLLPGGRARAAPARREATTGLLERLRKSWDAFKPQADDDVERATAYDPPRFAEVAHFFAGTGIAFTSGGRRLPSAVASALFIRRRLLSQLPIEIWHGEDEAAPTHEMVAVAAAHNIRFMVLPKAYSLGMYKWGDRWRDENGQFRLSESAGWTALKPLIVAASTFDTVVYMDDDIVPALDPSVMVDLLREGAEASSGSIDGSPRTSAVFFRDLWGFFPDASIWKVLEYPWPRENPMHYAPTQDSGVVVVCKSCNDGRGWGALALAGYLNYYHKTFYPALYWGMFDGPSGGNVAYGAGDKDTFQVAWMLRQERFRMMGPTVLVGPRTTQHDDMSLEPCGAAMGLPGADGTLVALHMVSFKISYDFYRSRMWESRRRWSRYGLSMHRAIRLQNPDDANAGDGHVQNPIVWRGVGRSGLTRCLQYAQPTVSTNVSAEVGWNLELGVRDEFALAFGASWMAAYMAPFPPPTDAPTEHRSHRRHRDHDSIASLGLLEPTGRRHSSRMFPIIVCVILVLFGLIALIIWRVTSPSPHRKHRRL